jgi:hypothetical protein
LSFQLVPELHSVLVSRKVRIYEGNVKIGSARSERALDLKILTVYPTDALKAARRKAELPPHVLQD